MDERHHPAAFAAALINSQPMGFYAPAQIIRDAREHGVEIRRIDINSSQWDCSLERNSESSPASFTSDKTRWGLGGPALRLGFRQIKGMRKDDADRIVAARHANGPFASVAHLQHASDISTAVIHRLARADALDSMQLNRRGGIWETMALSDIAAPLFDDLAGKTSLTLTPLPPMPASEEVIADYHTTGLSLKRHPVSFARAALSRCKISPAIEIQDAGRFPHGTAVRAAGLVLVRQRPGTAAGVVFVTLEDETGITNLIVWPSIYERYRRAIRHATLLQADGIIQRQGQVIHVLAHSLIDRTQWLHGLSQPSRDFH